MRRAETIRHEFVEFIPKELAEGILYISIPYTTAVHRCFCGCGLKVVTPIRPTDWRLTFDGETATLWPSIGNWDYPCRSHYWIRGDRVVWSGSMTQEQIERGRALDAEARDRYFASLDATVHADTSKAASPSQRAKRRDLWAWLRGR
jgi:hypothetical protein